LVCDWAGQCCAAFSHRSTAAATTGL
jgi:hypothetical protein